MDGNAGNGNGDDGAAAWNSRPGALTVQYPSEDFPAVPAFRLQIPGDWLALPATGSLLVVHAPRTTQGFRANVVVSARRLPPSETPDADLAESVNEDFAKPGFDLVVSRPLVASTRPAHVVLVRFAASDGTWVESHQLHVYVPSSTHSAHVLSVTGTIAADDAEERRETVRAMVSSLSIQRTTDPQSSPS